MRDTLRVLAVVSVLLVVAGCPYIPFINPYFTNADLSGSNRGGMYDNTPTSEVGEGEGEAGMQATREVTEPDVIRRDGAILYVLNQYRGLTIIDLDEQKTIAQVPTYGYPRDLYVVGDRAYVLVAYATDYTVEGNTVHFGIGSRVYVVDLTHPDRTEIPHFDLTGDFVDSRLVGDVLYAVCAQYQWNWVEPAVMKEQTSSSWVTSINVADPANIHQADSVSFDGMGSVIQATNSAIFVAAPDWMSNTTRITYVDISDPAGAMTVQDYIDVDGYVQDKFKMDAYNGVLRVVSNDWTWGQGRRNFIVTVDLADPANLAVLGQTVLEDASGQTLFASRFDGPRAYIVTFLVKDPLFVMDLSDPANPTVAGQLEIPGWSTHIEPRGNQLLALGVDDSDGMRRVSVRMFDVTDPAAPAAVGDKVTLGDDWSWSAAYGDVKAFTVLDDVLIVPFSGWTTTSGSYERLQFVSYSDAGLVKRGYVDVTGSVQRSFEYGARYYGVTSEQLVTINGVDLDAPEVEQTLTLAEYVADYFELTPGVDAQIIAESAAGKMRLRTLTPAGQTLGEIEAEMGSFVKSYVYGQTVVVVSTGWDTATYKGYYLVTGVDCTTPETPALQISLKVDVNPYWGYWYWDWRGMAGVGIEDAAVSSFRPWYPWWTPQSVTFLLGDTLALRCTGDSFDSTFGDDTAYQGLALVDLAAGTWTRTIGLGFNLIVSLDAVDDKLYLGTQQFAGFEWLMPISANYLRVLDVQSVSMGPAVNVPGTFVQYDPAADLLILRDDQWGDNWTLSTRLRSVEWNGSDPVDRIDAVKLPSDLAALMGRGAKIYVAAYDNGYRLSAVAVDATGRLDLGEAVLTTDQWASLLDAHGATAYLSMGGYQGDAVALYDFSGTPAYRDLFETMGYPASIRFGSAQAYLALGYAGCGKIPL